MRDGRGDEDRREVLLAETFSVLDQKRRGFISRVELAHILDAMQADTSVKFTVPEALVPTGNMKDSRVLPADLRMHLQKLTIADLEDVKWFAESVVRVETELREIWRTAVQRWRERVECLYKRDLHRYLLTSQPERVARWLLLRTSMDEVNNKECWVGLLGLGISQQEVEVLFTDETADDINRCSDKMEPFLTALDMRKKLSEACLEGELSERCSEEQDASVAELITKLVELAEGSRELACLLIHEDALSFATALVRSGAFSRAVVSEASRLIMALLSYRVQENARDYEKTCRQRVADFVEIGFDPGRFKLKEEVQKLHNPAKPGRLSLVRERGEPKETLSDWVGSLLTLPADFSRGEMLDVLIKFDERRLLLTSDGGDRTDESTAIAVSQFSYGRTVPHILSRLDVSSHHSLHEHRTPMRTHLWKLLLNVLSSAGDLGRRLFRAAEGMRVICSVVRGSSWGVEREEISPEEEEDRQEEEELCFQCQGTSGLQDPYNSWPHVESLEGPVREHRYYSMDFLDDKFYGCKDRMLANAFLEYMASDAMWGEEALVEEMMQYPNTLQTFCRLRPPGFAVMRMLLSAQSFPAYLEGVATRISEAFAGRSLQTTLLADATWHSLFPVCFDLTEGSSSCATLRGFRQEIVAVERKNIKLRILSHAYHSLQAVLRDERSKREAERAAKGIAAGDKEPYMEDVQLEREIADSCKLLASRLPCSLEEAGDVAVSIYMQVQEFGRKALLAGSRLPPVVDQQAQPETSVEATPEAAAPVTCASAPRRKTYFGHYQQLVNIQSGSTPAVSSSAPSPVEQQAPSTCQDGAADASGPSKTRLLVEPSLYPYEFLVVLRLVQLIRLRETSVPPFIIELQNLLENLTGLSTSTSSERREQREEPGQEYPWRTGLVQLTNFHVSEVPLRRSQLRLFPRHSPLDVVQGLEGILREYKALNMWEEEGGARSNAEGAKDSQQQEALAARQRSLLALVFNHLCYYHPKVVALEDSAQGLSLRLGLSLELLLSVRKRLSRPAFAGLRSGLEFAAAAADDSCRVFQATSVGTIVVVEVATSDGKVAFVCLRGAWSLWANCTEDASRVLTECSGIRNYFAFNRAVAQD